ncbi:hypothetical protein SFMTTN_0566 [Sulfuriferula multivorans]|uniref:Uncharacterized protein n=1 Tax=Sulfuriferula multivorans TaxID=1559896 RepID=A0A401JAR6_9PROT|nr:hypothetical protein SFMTTN_0566 [Sulfuriferula multivorans]
MNDQPVFRFQAATALVSGGHTLIGAARLAYSNANEQE